MITCGLTPSVLDGSESVYTASLASGADCSSYSYRDFMSEVMDQGSSSRCVAYSIAQVVEWYRRTCGVSKPRFDVVDLYSRRSGREGMSFKEAVQLLIHDGYTVGGLQREYIVDGVVLTSRRSVCDFILGNGPCLLGLPVYDASGVEAFWRGSSFAGYHAVVGVGFSDGGVELLNSWGSGYGSGGYGVLPWGEFGLVKEAWGLLF